MPSVEAPRATGGSRVLNPQTVTGGTGVYPSNGVRRANGPRSILRNLLASLNELLKLSDFSRGDIFRD